MFTRMQSNTLCRTCVKKLCFSSSAAGIVRRTTCQKSHGISSLVVLDGSVCRQFRDFVHKRLKFGYEHGRPTKTAWEAYQEGTEVCRDFAHLAVTFSRCMNIPARYCTGYLGDIGVPAMDAPMDSSGWFEAYLGGQWHVFDARFNAPRVGRVLMARGRDAADVAIVTTFGPNTLTGFEVTANEIVP
jgi:transglutaminase-like putative cysteine protease